MVKQRVLLFFGALLLLAGILLGVHLASLERLSSLVLAGAAVSDINDDGKNLEIVWAIQRGDFVYIHYTLKSDSPNAEQVIIGYTLNDISGAVLRDGYEEIIAEPEILNEYNLKFSVPDGRKPGILTLRAIFDTRSEYQTRSIETISRFSLTGSAIGEDSRRLVSSIAWIAVVLFVAVYIFIYQKKKRMYNFMAQGIDERFINLRDLKR